MGANRAVAPHNSQCEAIDRGRGLRSGHTIVPHRFGWQYTNGTPSDTARALGGHLLKGSSLWPFPHRKNAAAKPWADTVGALREIVLEGCPSRKLEAVHGFDFFRFLPHVGPADFSIFRHAMVRRFLLMFPLISALLVFTTGLFHPRASLCLEHLALRHQLTVYKQTGARPRLRPADRLFWAWRSRWWPGWQEVLVFVRFCCKNGW